MRAEEVLVEEVAVLEDEMATAANEAHLTVATVVTMTEAEAEVVDKVVERDDDKLQFTLLLMVMISIYTFQRRRWGKKRIDIKGKDL